MERELWATRIGLILAMAGNAVGLGNFLRFPVQAAENGGGAFMIPYFISFLLMGIPLMWFEWAMGRYGGSRGHGSMPAIFQMLWQHPVAKYLGIIGLVGPILICIYYIYIAGWTLAYAFATLFHHLPSTLPQGDLKETLKPFQEFFSTQVGKSGEGTFLRPSPLFLGGFLVVVLLNYLILRRGVARGIELLANIGMPLLFFFGIILAVRVLTLGAPVSPEASAAKGLNFLWEPHWGALLEGKVWLAAAGQIFFTLSLGMGAIPVYASYLKKKQDLVVSGLASASLNEFAEVILGGSIAIPAAVAFFGITAPAEIAREGGAFGLGFFATPAVFTQMPLGTLFGTLWFLLLFLAAITSSVALLQPGIAFLQDEFRWERGKAVAAVMGYTVCFSLAVIFIPGVLDSLDFWVGTYFITVFAFLELLVFLFLFGRKRAFAEVLEGAQVRIPLWLLNTLAFASFILVTGILVLGTGGIIEKLLDASPGEWMGKGIILITFLLAGLLVHRASANWHFPPPEEGAPRGNPGNVP